MTRYAVSSDHLINVEGSFLQHASDSKSVKVHACPGACPGHWSKSFYSVGSFLWHFFFFFISNDVFSEVRVFFCNDVGEMKWSFKHSEITCQNTNLHSPAVCTISIWLWRHSVFYWTNAWCCVKLEGKPILTHAIHACTQKWYTDMHAQLQPEDFIDFTVKLKSYSLYNSSCQQSESDINGNAQFTHLQVWTLYQNTHVNLILQSIFARKRIVPTNAHQPQDQCYCQLESYSMCLAFRLSALVLARPPGLGLASSLC